MVIVLKRKMNLVFKSTKNRTGLTIGIWKTTKVNYTHHPSSKDTIATVVEKNMKASIILVLLLILLVNMFLCSDAYALRGFGDRGNHNGEDKGDKGDGDR